jgi:hypothetical protein
MKFLIWLFLIGFCASCAQDTSDYNAVLYQRMQIDSVSFVPVWENITEGSDVYYIEATDTHAHFGLYVNKDHKNAPPMAEYSENNSKGYYRADQNQFLISSWRENGFIHVEFSGDMVRNYDGHRIHVTDGFIQIPE